MNTLCIAQTGVRESEITIEVQNAFMSAGRVVLHTRRMGCAGYLKANGIAFDALDDLYERAQDFDEHARVVADDILSSKQDNVVYAVMTLSDASVRELIKRAPSARVIGGGPYGELWARADGPVVCLCASDWQTPCLTADANALITEIDSRQLASEIKLKLMERYPETCDIFITRKSRAVERVPLTELDRVGGYDHRFGCLVPAQRSLINLERFGFEQLTALTRALRDPERGCEWDRKQSIMSLSRAAVEEAYELEDAILKRDDAAICEELGDVMFICALLTQIAREHGAFNDIDVLTGICKKMIRRHPHVFRRADGDSALATKHASAHGDEALHRIWIESKRDEKSFTTPSSAMRAVAESLPSLLRAYKIYKIMRDYGLPGEAPEALARGAQEAIESLARAADDESARKAAGEALTRVARLCLASGIEPEAALAGAIREVLACLPD